MVILLGAGLGSVYFCRINLRPRACQATEVWWNFGRGAEKDSGCWYSSEAESQGPGKMCHLRGHMYLGWELFCPQSSRVACMVGPKLCPCFHSSLKIQCQKGHGHPSLRGKNKLGRDVGVNNSGSVFEFLLFRS